MTDLPLSDLTGRVALVWEDDWDCDGVACHLRGAWVVWPSGARDWHSADAIAERLGPDWIEALRDDAVTRAWERGNPWAAQRGCEAAHIEGESA